MESEVIQNNEPVKRRVFEQQFKTELARRLLGGESGTQLSQQYRIPCSMLYRWRNAYLQEGAAGLKRRVGRPPGKGRLALTPRHPEAAARRVVELERKVGQQALEIDFLRRTFKRVKQLEQPGGGNGASGSTEKFAPGSSLKDI
jgi:transposase-like protein